MRNRSQPPVPQVKVLWLNSLYLQKLYRGRKMSKIDINSMTETDIENLADFFCDGCCRSCENCIGEFVRDLRYYVEEYNKKCD